MPPVVCAFVLHLSKVAFTERAREIAGVAMGWREQQKFLGVDKVGVCGRMKSLEVNERALLFEGSLGWATLGVCAGAVLLLLLELGPCACVLLLGASCRPSVCRPVSMMRFGSGRNYERSPPPLQCYVGCTAFGAVASPAYSDAVARRTSNMNG